MDRLRLFTIGMATDRCYWVCYLMKSHFGRNCFDRIIKILKHLVSIVDGTNYVPRPNGQGWPELKYKSESESTSLKFLRLILYF